MPLREELTLASATSPIRTPGIMVNNHGTPGKAARPLDYNTRDVDLLTRSIYSGCTRRTLHSSDADGRLSAFAPRLIKTTSSISVPPPAYKKERPCLRLLAPLPPRRPPALFPAPATLNKQPGVPKGAAAGGGGSGGSVSSPARRKPVSAKSGGRNANANVNNKGDPSVGPVPGGVSGSSIYCVCHSSDEGFMVECSDGTGGCGGWFHPECCNLELSPEQRQKSECFECRASFSVSLSLCRCLCSL